MVDRDWRNLAIAARLILSNDPQRRIAADYHVDPQYVNAVRRRLEQLQVPLFPARRRTMHPATREEPYDNDEREFIIAMEKYMAMNDRKFPGFSEVLQVAYALGYRKVAESCATPKYQKRGGVND